VEKKSTLEEGGGPVRKDQFPFKKKSKRKKKSRNPQESLKVSIHSPLISGRDIEEVKGAGGVVKAGEGRNQIPFCVDEIRHHHFALD